MRCHACDTPTDGQTVKRRAVFCLSRIRKKLLFKSNHHTTQEDKGERVYQIPPLPNCRLSLQPPVLSCWITLSLSVPPQMLGTQKEYSNETTVAWPQNLLHRISLWLVCSNLISLQMPVDLIDVCNDVGSKCWLYVDLWAKPAPIDINGFHLMDQITRNILCYIEQQESV